MTPAHRRWRSWAATVGGVAAVVAAIGTPTVAQTPPGKAPDRTSVVAEFPSGVGHRDAAELWDALAPLWQSQNVGIRKITPRADHASLCAIVEQYLKMQAGACTDRLAGDLLVFSARNGGATTFRPGSVLHLPLIEVETFKSMYHFDLKSRRQRGELEALYQDPGFKAAKQREFLVTGGRYAPKTFAPGKVLQDLPADGLVAIETQGVRWKVPLAGEVTSDSLVKLEDVTTDLSTPSRVIGIERAAPLQRVPAQKFAPMPPAVLATQCTGDPPRTPPVSYAGLLTTDPIHRVADLEDAQACASAVPPPQIAVIDTPIKAHPDLKTALGLPAEPAPTGGSLCGLAGGAEMSHGTYVASLIAARGEHAPYKGINPNVRLVHVSDENGPLGVRQQLRDAFNEGFPSNPPQIALYASAFGTQEPAGRPAPSPKDLANRYKRHNGKWLEELRNSQTRLAFPPFARHVVDSINYRYLFVVSAGQDNTADNFASPLALRDVTNMSPQNLGTLHNVLVVTACTACDAPNGDAALWPRANYGTAGDQIVQLAAPGGDYIPGIVSEQHTGGPDNGGTSAAAAIVAGIASRMLACYPTTYRNEPRLMKERLLVTARRNLNPDDAPRAQAGIVDPHVAMIDPERTWLKPTGLPLEPVDIAGWCSTTLDMKRDDAGEPVPESPVQARIRRITRAGAGYTVREMARHSVGQDTPPLKITELEPDEGQDERPIAVVSRAGKPNCHLFLRNVQDLIVGFDELRRPRKTLHVNCTTTDAAALKPCFEE